MNCKKCGNPVSDHACFCEFCGQAVEHTPEVVQKPENMVAGIVGAFLGSLIGGGCIILLSQLGFVSALSGLVLAVCTLKGYELLGGRLSRKGIVIAVVLMLVTPYLADRIDWAIVIFNEFADYGITFAEAFAIVPVLIQDESIELSSYLTNLAMIYGFVLLGAVSTVRAALKKK